MSFLLAVKCIVLQSRYFDILRMIEGRNAGMASNGIHWIAQIQSFWSDPSWQNLWRRQVENLIKTTVYKDVGKRLIMKQLLILSFVCCKPTINVSRKDIIDEAKNFSPSNFFWRWHLLDRRLVRFLQNALTAHWQCK